MFVEELPDPRAARSFLLSGYHLVKPMCVLIGFDSTHIHLTMKCLLLCRARRLICAHIALTGVILRAPSHTRGDRDRKRLNVTMLILAT